MDTPEQIIDSFLDFKRHNEGRSAGTARRYRAPLLELLAYCREVKCNFLQPDQDTLAAYTGPHLHRRGLVAGSRKVAISGLRGFYDWLHRSHGATEDYGRLLVSPKLGLRLPTSMSLEAAEKLMWAPDLGTFIGVRDAAILGMLLGCGLRVQGVVDLNESWLRFEHVDGREVLSVKVLEKGNKERMMPAPDETRLLVRAYLGHQELEQIDRSLPDGDQVLFVNARNRQVPAHEHRGEKRRLTTGAIRQILLGYAERAGIPMDMAHPHAIRHLYGTELAESEVDKSVRQLLMGHADANSTEIYTHLAQRSIRRAVGEATPLNKIRTPVSDLLKRLG